MDEQLKETLLHFFKETSDLMKEIRQNTIEAQIQAILNLRKWMLAVVTLSATIIAIAISMSLKSSIFKNNLYILSIFLLALTIFLGLYYLKRVIIYDVENLGKTHEELQRPLKVQRDYLERVLYGGEDFSKEKYAEIVENLTKSMPSQDLKKDKFPNLIFWLFVASVITLLISCIDFFQILRILHYLRSFKLF